MQPTDKPTMLQAHSQDKSPLMKAHTELTHRDRSNVFGGVLLTIIQRNSSRSVCVKIERCAELERKTSTDSLAGTLKSKAKDNA